MTTTKIDIYNSGAVWGKTLKKFKSDKNISEINKKYVIRFLEDASIGKASSSKSRPKGMGIRSRLKLLFSFKITGKYFNLKDFKKLTVKDMEQFVKDLDSNQIKKTDDGSYAGSSKSDIKESFIRILRWLHGEHSQKFIKMTGWIDLSYQNTTTTALTEREIKELLSKCKTNKQKMIVCCLFDGGFRIEEFLNIRNSDVTLVEGNAPFYRLRVRTEFSKTKGRNIGMYWSESYNIIKEWIDSKEKSLGAEETLFIGTYDGVRKILNKLGKTTGKKIYPHLFRHSSCTYYASKINVYQMNLRFGWSHSSNMAQTYIDDSGVSDEVQVKEYEDTKIQDLQVKIRKVEEESKFKNEEIKSMNKKMRVLADYMQLAFMKIYNKKELEDMREQVEISKDGDGKIMFLDEKIQELKPLEIKQ